MNKRMNHKKWIALFCLCIFLGAGSPLLQAASEDPETTADAEKTSSSFFNRPAISTSRPFQVQVQLTGGGKYGRRSYNPGAALHLGYQFSELMYLGLTSQAFYNDDSAFDDDDDKQYDDERIYGQEGASKTTVRSDPRHLIEMRFFPWDFGLYFSAGVMHHGYEKTVTEFKSRPRIINENQYVTGLTTQLEYREWTGAATGIGFNYLFANGFSLASGINVGLAVLKPKVTITSDVAINATDLAEWKDQIEANEKKVPLMFHIGVGYAF
ncbi:hypothetical protein KKI24_31065 [bacterium]|nr:hypothetical protein [bacterium]